MARIRTIKPDITESETLAELPLAACFTFTCLWPHCDDRGRRKAQPRLVKADLYPMRDDVTVEDVAEHVTMLAELELVCLYTGCDGKPYLHVVNWDEHQKVDRPSKSRIPPCRDHEADSECARHEGDCTSSPWTLSEASSYPREDLASPPETASNGPRTVDLVPRTVDLVPRTVDHGPGTVDLAPAKPSRGAREPDEVWDTLLDACGVDATSVTQSSRGAYNRAVSDLRQVEAAPPEIRRRAENFRARWPEASLTPTALARRWAECDVVPTARPPTSDTDRALAISRRNAQAAQASSPFDRKALP